MKKELKNILGGLLAAFLIYLTYSFGEANFNIAYWGNSIRACCASLMFLAYFVTYMVQKGGEKDLID